jgi:predicted transcriptional regulator
MELASIIEKLGLKVFTSCPLDRAAKSAYCGDLLSDVMAKSKDGAVWVTTQNHPNVVAVGLLTGASAVILTGGQTPDRETLERANREAVPLFGTLKDSFQVSGELWELGLRT